MKPTNYRKMAMTFGGILIATLAVGCYGGGSGYSNGGYGYNSSYSSYGNSYPYSGYSSPRSYGNSYNTGYQSGVRADANRDRGADRVTGQRAVAVNRDSAVARTETTHSSVDRTEKN
jgi:hypothetical protein